MTDAPLRAALTEVFKGHEWIDFDWNGWRERARQALATPPVVVTNMVPAEYAQCSACYGVIEIGWQFCPRCSADVTHITRTEPAI